MTKVYPVIITPTKDGYVVYVPDFNVNTQGSTLADAIYMSRDVIGICGIDMQDDGKPLPEPSISTPTHDERDIVSWIDIDFAKYRLANDMSTMRINVSLPTYLKARSDEAGLSCSQVLQEALRERLRID